MSLFSKSVDEMKKPFSQKVLEGLVQKDGRTHITMFHIVGDSESLQISMNCVDHTFGSEMDAVLTAMQAGDYEIVDVKFQLYVHAAAMKMNRYDVMVMYK
ncbi:MAG: hypothetical protein RSG59_08570 [Ruthenibacterium sp.]